MADKVTVPRIRAMKARGERIVCVTAYDAPMGKLADQAGMDVVLVGDSVGNVLLGYDNAIPVELEDMVHHTRAVRSGVERALLVSDLPFGSYQVSVEQAIQSSIALVKAGAEAVKLEGPNPAVRPLVEAGIPVMGHVGMTPQSVHAFGGFKVQGRGDDGEHVLDAARQLDEAGVFAMVLELIPADLAKRITEAVSCPTIGIGAGPSCDGQVQVLNDILGLSAQTFKHAKEYATLRTEVANALSAYASDVRSGGFPGAENSF